MSSTKNFRIKLDALIQNAKSIKKSVETTLAWRSLQMAKAWLGKSVAYKGDPTPEGVAKALDAIPYTAASNASEIPPTGNVATEAFALYLDNHLGNVNLMRDQIQATIDSIEGVIPTEPKQAECYRNCLLHLNEAKFAYGFELQEMREQEQDAAKFREQMEEVLGNPLAILPPNGNQLESDPLDLEKKSPSFVVEAVVPPVKNLGNENKADKKEQQGATGKKG